MDQAIEKLLNTNMGIHMGERVLVFTDHMQEGRFEPAGMDRCRRLEGAVDRVVELSSKITTTQFYKYEALPSNGYEPPEAVWTLAFGDKAVEGLKKAGILQRLITKKAMPGDVEMAHEILSDHTDDMVDAVIAMSNFSTSHTRFRHLLTKIKGTRYASMPLFDPEMFSGPMDVDWDRIAKRTESIAGLLTRTDSVIMRSPIGTDINLSIRGRTAHADTGILTAKGSFGNLPAGEVYIAPVEGTSEGVLVLEWSTTRRLSPRVSLTIKDGRVVGMEGDPKFLAYIEGVFKVSPEAANIAELGIGTNDKAARPDNILEAEKILGTTHIAFGDNTAFGGTNSANFHEDYVFFSPTLILEYGNGKSETIIDHGRLKSMERL